MKATYVHYCKSDCGAKLMKYVMQFYMSLSPFLKDLGSLKWRVPVRLMNLFSLPNPCVPVSKKEENKSNPFPRDAPRQSSRLERKTVWTFDKSLSTLLPNQILCLFRITSHPSNTHHSNLFLLLLLDLQNTASIHPLPEAYFIYSLLELSSLPPFLEKL